MATNYDINNIEIEWLIHDCFKIKAHDLVIYTDPYKLRGNLEKADLILVSHDHYDHCDPDSIELIKKEDTVIVTNQKASEKISGAEVMSAGETKNVKGVEIKAIPAYNIKPERQRFHPKENGGLGFIFKVNGTSFYHCGDTDAIPEMEDLDVDVAFLCVSGTYVMSPEEAAEAVQMIKPKVAIPMHYGAGVAGAIEDAEKFKQLVGDKAKVVILEPKLK